MVQGHVKWFSNPKGYGFILMDDGSEVFVHHSLIEGDGYKTLKEGELVDFELVESDKGKQAHKVVRKAQSGSESDDQSQESNETEAATTETESN